MARKRASRTRATRPGTPSWRRRNHCEGMLRASTRRVSSGWRASQKALCTQPIWLGTAGPHLRLRAGSMARARKSLRGATRRRSKRSVRRQMQRSKKVWIRLRRITSRRRGIWRSLWESGRRVATRAHSSPSWGTGSSGLRRKRSRASSPRQLSRRCAGSWKGTLAGSSMAASRTGRTRSSTQRRCTRRRHSGTSCSMASVQRRRKSFKKSGTARSKSLIKLMSRSRLW
mmetsp:Transcript_34692/g.73934  ORF Transcript_34692/g.73934 Transcript_34692/m.73934 type:complete len:229 (+) Transcript_34692:1726-2412(+)